MTKLRIKQLFRRQRLIFQHYIVVTCFCCFIYPLVEFEEHSHSSAHSFLVKLEGMCFIADIFLGRLCF